MSTAVFGIVCLDPRYVGLVLLLRDVVNGRVC